MWEVGVAKVKMKANSQKALLEIEQVIVDHEH
jgi:hypothetical protein